MGVAGAVDASEADQGGVIEALHPDREAIDAGGTVGGEARALDRARIGLQRDLGVRGDAHVAADPLEQTRNGVGREQARCAAAQEDASHEAPGDALALGFEIGEQRRHVFVLGRKRRHVSVEIAVRAPAHAPRQMHVERERRWGASPAFARRGAHRVASRAMRHCMALARWLMAFLAAGSSSAAVQSCPGTRNTGS